MLRQDSGLRRVLRLEVPSSDACGDWMRSQGAGEGLAQLGAVHEHLLRRFLHREEQRDYTLDIDATQIVAEKREAKVTYKGERGYMPLVGHLAENGLVIHEEFRDGNASPGAGNLEFLKACAAKLPKGKRIAAIRADSAAYQAKIFNWCEETGKTFAIGADQDAATRALIASIPASRWKPYRDGEIAETVHCMNQTKAAFRLIVLRRARQQDLFEKDGAAYTYALVASNRANETAAETWDWYAKRGDASENRIKDLKIGLGMEYMPCGTTAANAIWFRIGVIAYNLTLGFRALSGEEHARSQPQTLRWRILNTAGKIVRHAGQLTLRIAGYLYDTFAEIRQRCTEIATEAIAA